MGYERLQTIFSHFVGAKSRNSVLHTIFKSLVAELWKQHFLVKKSRHTIPSGLLFLLKKWQGPNRTTIVKKSPHICENSLIIKRNLLNVIFLNTTSYRVNTTPKSPGYCQALLQSRLPTHPNQESGEHAEQKTGEYVRNFLTTRRSYLFTSGREKQVRRESE